MDELIKRITFLWKCLAAEPLSTWNPQFPFRPDSFFIITIFFLTNCHRPKKARAQLYKARKTFQLLSRTFSLSYTSSYKSFERKQKRTWYYALYLIPMAIVPVVLL